MNFKYVNIIFLMVVIILQSNGSVYGQADRKYIRQGNGKYSDGKFQESEVLYRKALDFNSASSDAGFNLGDALYRQNKYEDAARLFEGNSAAVTDAVKKADSFYNLGNSYLKAGKFEEAIAAYKNSLRLVPGKNEAKYNLAWAQDRLREKQEQEKNNKDKNEEPSEYAKKLKAEADKLVAEGRFIEAFNLMQEGLKKDKTVAYYNTFIEKTGKVAKIDAGIK